MNRFAALIFTAVALAPAAHAGPVVGLQTEYAATTPDRTGPSGFGFSGRLGYGLDIGVVEVVPEVEVAKFSEVWIPKLGGRVMVGKGIEPGLYGHLLLPMWRQSTPIRGWDAGAVLDFTAAPMLDVGLHGGAMIIDGAPKRQITPVFGVHAALVF